MTRGAGNQGLIPEPGDKFWGRCNLDAYGEVESLVMVYAVGRLEPSGEVVVRWSRVFLKEGAEPIFSARTKTRVTSGMGFRKMLTHHRMTRERGAQA